MSDRRFVRLATTGARLLAGTLVAALFATAVVTAVALPWPTLTREPLTVAANPAPADTVVVCAGGLLTLGGDPQQAGALSVAAEQNVVWGAPDDVAAVESVLTATSVPGSGGVAVVTAAPRERTRSAVAASGSASVAGDALAGFAASACQAPLIDSWIVGGATTTGANDLLVLGNPGDVPATVQLTVYGATGPQIPPGGADLVLAAGEQQVVPLAGLALGETSPVVRVTASGAPVQAALQASITRTLVPGGVDQSAAVVGAATTQVIPGVTVTAEPVPTGLSNDTTVLRLLSADADTIATVTTIDETGAVAAPQQVPLVAGLPIELALNGLAVGSHTVRVDAAGPVVAAVWETTGFDAGSDFAWYAAAPRLTGDGLVAVPEGPDPTLWVYNADSEQASVTLESLGGGDPVALTIPAGQAVSERLATGNVYRVRPSSAAVHALVSFTGDGALAGMPVWPEAAAADAVVVYP